MARTKKTTPQRKAVKPRGSRQTASSTEKRRSKNVTRRTPRCGTRQGTTKTAAALALLNGDDGATLAELMKATGWQAHSVRGFLSATVRKRLKLPLRSTAPSRRYWIEQGEQSTSTRS